MLRPGSTPMMRLGIFGEAAIRGNCSGKTQKPKANIWPWTNSGATAHPEIRLARRKRPNPLSRGMRRFLEEKGIGPRELNSGECRVRIQLIGVAGIHRFAG